jgi:hypothetical protein
VADTAELFLAADGAPRLRRCAVLFLDLLGVREMARSTEASAHLAAVDRAVRSSYRDFLDPASELPAAVFSDTLVIAAPIRSKQLEPVTVLGLVTQGALAQLGLIEQGLFARGGLAVGDFHIHDNLIFGRALVDAYERENKDAVHPRVILDKPVEAMLRERGAGEDVDDAGSFLSCDEDGWVFIDYLGPVFDSYEDARPRLKAHRDALVAKLAQHSKERRHWEKYRWVAEYHNDAVRTRAADGAELLVPADGMTWRFSSFSP